MNREATDRTFLARIIRIAIFVLVAWLVLFALFYLLGSTSHTSHG